MSSAIPTGRLSDRLADRLHDLPRPGLVVDPGRGRRLAGDAAPPARRRGGGLQHFGEDLLPLVLLFAISVTGLMLTASYTWMKGYAYDFLAILHAITVIFTLLWLPFGKFFHIFQRPAHLAVAVYKDVGRQGEQAECRRCGEAFASRMHVEDLITVEHQLGYRYETKRGDDGTLPVGLPALPAGAVRRWRRRNCGANARSGIGRGRRARLGREMLNGLFPVAVPYARPSGSSSRTVVMAGDTDRATPTSPTSSARTARMRSARTGAAAEPDRARQDALLLLRPAVRHSAQGQGQPGRRLRAVGGVPVQPRHALPQGRQALPARVAPRSLAQRLRARPERPAAVSSPCRTIGRSEESPLRSSASNRPTAIPPSPCSAAPV